MTTTQKQSAKKLAKRYTWIGLIAEDIVFN